MPSKQEPEARPRKDRRRSHPQLRLTTATAVVLTERDDIREDLESRLEVARHISVKGAEGAIELLDQPLPLTGVVIDAEMRWERVSQYLAALRSRWARLDVVAIGRARTGVVVFGNEEGVHGMTIGAHPGAFIERAVPVLTAMTELYEDRERGVVDYAKENQLSCRETDVLRSHLSGMTKAHQPVFLRIAESTHRNTLGKVRAKTKSLDNAQLILEFEAWLRRRTRGY